MQRELDALDRELIEALRSDGRTPNKALAARLDVSEATIAARIRALKQSRTMKVTLQRDMYAFGYQYLCVSEVYVAGRAVDAVARDIVRLPGIASVSVLLGTPDLFFSFYARSRDEISATLTTRIARIKGVEKIETHIALDLVKHDSGLADLADTAS